MAHLRLNHYMEKEERCAEGDIIVGNIAENHIDYLVIHLIEVTLFFLYNNSYK